MLRKIAKIIHNPRKYLARALRLALWKISALWGDKSFFLQAQMDIAPSSLWYNKEFVGKFGGFFINKDVIKREIAPWRQPWDTVRRDMIILLLRSLTERSVPGAFAEFGVYKGETAKLIHHYCPERKLYLYDTFSGFGDRMVASERKHTGETIPRSGFSDTSEKQVVDFISATNDNIIYVIGYFPESITGEMGQENFAFVHLDADLFDSMSAGLRWFYPRINKGGIILMHDFNAWHGARAAVEEFFRDKPETIIPMPDKSGSALIVRL